MGLAGILNLGARAYEALGLYDLATEAAKLGISEERTKKKVRESDLLGSAFFKGNLSLMAVTCSYCIEI